LGSFKNWFSSGTPQRGSGGGDLGALAEEVAAAMQPEDKALAPPALRSATFADQGNKPVGVRLSPEWPMQWLPAGPHRPLDGVTCPVQVPFDFETELFKGRAVVYLKGLDNTPDRVFKGKARAIQFTVQGRFKREVAMDDLHFGMCLARPLQKLPTRWLLSLCTRVVRSLGAQYSMELSDPTVERPFMTAPIALATQMMSCNAPGEEPDLALPPIEDTARLAWLSEPATSSSQSGAASRGAGGNANKSISPSDRRKKIGKIIRDAKKKRGAGGSAAGSGAKAPPKVGAVQAESS
jgi:hypothetical protein